MTPTSGITTARRLAATLFAAALLLGAAACDSSRPSNDERSGRQGRQDELSWEGCGSHLECATLPVPLDHDHPRGETIDVAVIRRPAADPDSRIGTLVVDPGGPGGSGIEMVRVRGDQMSRLGERFDIVGFDPRGSGQSAPLHCLDGEGFDHYFETDQTPDTASEADTLEKLNRSYTKGCERDSGRLLASLDTESIAADIDVLREALGEKKISYLGLSYGTFLGAVYAELFPGRVRAMVLDGALDPELSYFDFIQGQAEGLESDLDRFLDACPQRDTCTLGEGPAAERSLRSLLDDLDDAPLPVGERSLSQTEAVYGLATGLYQEAFWPQLDQALGAATTGDGAALLALFDAYTGRSEDGSYSTTYDAYNATLCVDGPAPSAFGDYERLARRLASSFPFFGPPLAYFALPCAAWPVPPQRAPHPIEAAGAGPVLVVGATRDPVTPYAWSQALASQLAGGILLTREGGGHTSYFSSSCVAGVVDDYLISADPPAEGKTCS